jgi:hypothetical protein
VLGNQAPSVCTPALVRSGVFGPLGLEVRSTGSGGDVRGISNLAILAPAVLIVEGGLDR